MIPELNEIIEKPENRKEEIAEAAEIKIKYKGYIEREKMVADKMHRLEDIKIRGHFNYSDILEISTEGRQKLEKINPETLAQASRIPGVSPSDINVLLVMMGRPPLANLVARLKQVMKCETTKMLQCFT